MSLLTKFQNVQINPSNSILKGEDKEYCEDLEKNYLSAFQFHETHLEFFLINKEENKFLDFVGMSQDVKSSIETLNKSFVEMVVYHFKEKYKITLDSSEIQSKIFPEDKITRRYMNEENEKFFKMEKLSKLKISLLKITTLIQDSLDGFSLNEKAENEIKEKFYNSLCKRYNKDKLDLKKNRIEFEYTSISFDNTWGDGKIRFDYRSDTTVRSLFNALSLFESGSSTSLKVFEHFYSSDHHKSEYIFSEIPFELDKIKSIKFYKNSKMVIKFKSDEVAQEFFKNYCKNGI